MMCYICVHSFNPKITPQSQHHHGFVLDRDMEAMTQSRAGLGAMSGFDPCVWSQSPLFSLHRAAHSTPPGPASPSLLMTHLLSWQTLWS